ncbi:MAG: response regulator [Chthoniobacteraceae bacterium]
MKTPLHILHLEDDPADAGLIQSTLEREGISCATTRVQTRDEFIAELEFGGFDLILSDFSLPAFDGLSAVEIAHARWPDLPIILVSGTLGEERAIDALKSGATDYVLKDRLMRLAPAVRRAMQEVEERIERRRLEAQFIEAQKMEVIGQLASGVAHDFNNILAIIMFSSDLMTEDLAPESPLRAYTEEIRLASERAAGLTRQLLVFSRKQTVDTVVLDLNETVIDLDKMLRRLIGENIEMKIVPGKGIGNVKADAGYIGQLVMNLVVNARDAMPSGGKLTIATANAGLDGNHEGAPAGANPCEYIMLSVSDTGTGMDEEVKGRLFEAFFTTKPKGKGTGLGLATCQTIVQQCGGHIDVESEVGKGTTFKIYIPRIEQTVAVAAKPAQSRLLPRGTETLLIVEDEPSVRHLACRLMEALGYEVLSASNGREALQVAREHRGAAIALVVTDVIMPRMGGMAVAESLRTSHPGLKILFTSGYTDGAMAQDWVLDHGVAFLPKPYTPGVLARRIRGMLDNGTKPDAPKPDSAKGPLESTSAAFEQVSGTGN